MDRLLHMLGYNLCIFGALVSDAKRSIQKSQIVIDIYMYIKNVMLGNVREKIMLFDSVYFAKIKACSR